MTIDKLQEARQSHVLSQRIRYRGQVYTWQELLGANLFASKFVHVEKYARRKINGCYAELKNPKTEYMLRSADGYFIDCPKIVWDASELPEE